MILDINIKINTNGDNMSASDFVDEIKEYLDKMYYLESIDLIAEQKEDKE